MKERMRDGEVLTVQEAAAFLRVHLETIRRLARKGVIPAFKVGTDWRFRRHALSEWAGREPARKRAPRVLVVDDEAVVLRFAASVLKGEGYQVRLASGGAEGLLALEQEDVDLVLLDLQMPEMPGPLFLAEVRASGRDVPVIIMTGHPDSALMAEALIHGPLTLLAKPVKPAQLSKAVKAALSAAKENLEK